MLSSLSRWIWSFRLRLGQAWRQWLRHERPSRLAVRWTLRDGLIVFLACLGVGLISAWPWLVQPSLRPGLPAPFEIRAPQDASVVDSEALAQRRSQLGPRIQVQITDQNATTKLERRLKRMLAELLNSRTAGEMRLTPIAITAEDEAFLLTQTPQQLQQWQLAVEQAQQRMLTQGVVSTLAEGQLERAAKLQLDRLAEPGRSLGAKLITRSLQGSTNLRTDNSLTQVLLNDLIQQNGVPKIEVKAGEVITVKGEVISQRAYDVLDAFGLISRRPATGLFLVRWIEARIAAGLMLLICRRWRTDLEIPQALLLLGTLAVVQGCKLWFGASVSALAVLVPPSLLLAEGLGAASGLAWLSLATFLWPIPLNSVGTARLLLAAAVAVVGVLLAGRQRSRAEMLQNAVLLTVAALLVEAALIQLMGGSVGGELLSEGILMGGLLLLALLISPTVERLFGMITRSRLLELCDLQRPLLRKLSSEAPGTFEHTLMICGLAEEGVRAIGGDVDLVRTGALYHDVGKLHAPQWFIENQQGDNPHDHLDDPWRSAEILQAHVDEGIKMARRYGLPQPVADFIPEHQGTLRMGYFWHRAREQNPNASDRPFRYRGPKPQSKESAVMMLADGCEAALRAMPPETDEAQACDGVRRIIHSRRHDGQLDDSGLGTGEIELVVRAFVKVWRRMRHRRIPYPIPARKAFSA